LSDKAVIAFPFDGPPMGLFFFEMVFKKQAIAAPGERKVCQKITGKGYLFPKRYVLPMYI
jgi:hypothetical protein